MAAIVGVVKKGKGVRFLKKEFRRLGRLSKTGLFLRKSV